MSDALRDTASSEPSGSHPPAAGDIRPLRIIDRLSTAFGWLAGLAVIVLMLHIVADVLSRNLTGQPIAGTTEYSQYWYMPAIVFLALAFTELKDEHIKATLLTDGLPPRLRRVAELTGYALGLLGAGLLTWFSWIAADYALGIGQTALGVVVVQIWIPKFFMLVGFALLALQLVARFIRVLLSSPDEDVTAPELTLGEAL